MGICLEDPASGKLSFNMGVIQGDAGKLTLKINYRYPVTKSYDGCAPKLDEQFAAAGFQKVSEAHKKALYVDPKTGKPIQADQAPINQKKQLERK